MYSRNKKISLYLLTLLVLAQGALSAYIPYNTDLDRFNSQESQDNNIALQLNNEEESKILSSPLRPHSHSQQLYSDNSLYGLINKEDDHFNFNTNEGGGGGNLRKRYPTHLDPFLQAKQWFRSGECPKGGDGATLFFCPLPTKEGTWNCVDDHQLCDGVKHCPQADDESPLVCMFYKAMQSQINFVANGISSQSMKSEADYEK